MNLSRIARASLGCLAAALGLLALLGWYLGIPILATLSRGRIPMAPIGAIMFMLFGAALVLRGLGPSTRLSRPMSEILVSTCAILAACILLLSLFGVNLLLPLPGLHSSPHFSGPQDGQMSPVTAACFIISALSFLLPGDGSLWRSLVALCLTSLLLAACLVFFLGYLFSLPLLYGSGFVPPALSTILGFAALGLGLVFDSPQGLGPFAAMAESELKRMSFLIPILLLFVVGSLAAAILYFRGYEARVRMEVERQLEGISNLKAEGLIAYRRERLGDAALFFDYPPISSLAKTFLQAQSGSAVPALLDSLLGRYTASQGYDRVYLLDAGGRVALSAPENGRPLAAALSLAVAGLDWAGRPSFVDFYRDEEDGQVRLALLVPLLAEGLSRRPLGVLVLRIDPRTYLYPFIQSWPSASQSAETLLIRRGGDRALFLNDLRFGDNAALNLSFPLTDEKVPAVRAALGQQGIVDGIDYRDVPVIAHIRAVPDSPWFLVAKMDRSEAFAALKERLWLMIVFMLLLLAGVGSGLVLFWRSQKMRFYREQLDTALALQETATFLEKLITYANAPILVWDSQFRLTRVNQAFEALTGRDAKELVGSPLAGLVPHKGVEEALRAIRETGRGRRWEAAEIDILDSKGESRTILWNSAPLYAADGETIVATIAQGQDITALKEAEGTLREQVAELTRWQNVMLGRESRILELKWEVNELLSKAGAQPRYGDGLYE